MDSTDAFFTQTVVGAPHTVTLGRRSKLPNSAFQGLEINLAQGESALSHLWREWVVLSHSTDAPGLPRKRPGKLRRWLERHALWLAILGLTSIAATLVFWGYLLWK